MIIVEGADKTGKSTLCHILAKSVGAYHHFTILPEGFDCFWGYAEQAHLSVVWDRGWMSELAYSVACQRKSLLSQAQRVMVQQMLKLYGAVNVTVTCEPAVLAKRLDDMHDDKFDKSIVLDANRWYKANYLYYGTDVLIKCDARKPFPNDRDVSRILELHEKRAATVREVIGDHLCLQKILPFVPSAASQQRAG